MAYPYTNDEIQTIAETVADLLFGWITEDINSNQSYENSWYLINGFSDQAKLWEPFCMYAEKYSPITKKRGFCKEMLSREQIAIVCALIKQTTIRASELLEQSTEFKSIGSRFFVGGCT